MTNKKDENKQILYSCYSSINREGEHFVPEHTISFQLSGSVQVFNSGKAFTMKERDIHFFRRNQLAKFVKIPPANGEYKAVSLFIDNQTLRSVSDEYGYKANRKDNKFNNISLNGSPLLPGFLGSLQAYMHLPQNDVLIRLKIREAVLLLVREFPALTDVLFDFSEPYKIDLEAFMQKNFRFNVTLDRFAYLSGRSLATFKRDFQKVFNISPRQWLQKRRLQEAYYLLTEKGNAASDVYLSVGFEDLSHFSHAFKKIFGTAPSKINT